MVIRFQERGERTESRPGPRHAETVGFTGKRRQVLAEKTEH